MRDKLSALAAFAKSRWAPDVDPSAHPLRQAGQVGTVISVVVVGVVALIGILIFSQIQGSLPAISNAELDNSSANVVQGFADAMQLVPIVLLVLVAALVIGIVQRLRQ